MSEITKELLLKELSTVIAKNSKKDIVSLGLISGISINGRKVSLAITIDPKKSKEMEEVRKKAQEVIENINNVDSATVILTAEKTAKNSYSNIKYFIAVASGKGGVGKSTLASNLAQALSSMGKKVGLLDADIYGASQPRMMGIGVKPEVNEDNKIIPPIAHGVKLMSMGFFINEESPLIWRGPMVHGAINQLIDDVAWGDLDVLIIDTPPGTGDVQISIAKKLPLSGVVIVTTPQAVALSEAKKSLLMFKKVGAPILGIVENMSYHICSECGNREDIFDHGKSRKMAKALNVDFLGEIPLNTAIRIASDSGKPFVTEDNNDELVETYKNIVSRIWTSLPDRLVRKKLA